MHPAPSSWSIPGSDGESILGDTHVPMGQARGVVIIAHGFKGYKDYGFLPRLAESMASAGFIAHRFNFSHSGMTNEIERFARPGLFERDTWNRQVFDLRAVIEAAVGGTLGGTGVSPVQDPRGRDGRATVPFVLFGHSRGGVTALLTTGRFAGDPAFPQPAGVITAAAPAECNPLSQEEASLLLSQGWLDSPSSRTGQMLRLGKPFLHEQLDDPASHDLPALVGRIRCPILIVHGESDPTVPVQSASLIARSAKFPSVVVVPGGDHVFNTPNPMPADSQPSPQLAALVAATTEFAMTNAGG